MHTESPTLLIYTVFLHEGHYASKVGDLPAHQPSWHGSFMIHAMKAGGGLNLVSELLLKIDECLNIQTLISQRRDQRFYSYGYELYEFPTPLG